jgi:mono/diheme cytochrome c family protein
MEEIMRARLAVAGVLTLVLVGSWAVAQTVPGNPKKGEAIYQKNCLRCHGQSGDGLGPDARDLIVAPANFHTMRSRSKTDMEMLIIISHGIIFSPMHAWRDRLGDQDIIDVLSYIRSLAPFNPVT